MRKRILLTNEDGAVAVMVALLLVVFLGFTALVVDIGYLAYTKRQMQTAVDAAALAGAREILYNGDAASVTSTIHEYVAKNNVQTTELEPAPAVNADYDKKTGDVSVWAEREVDLFFARAIGFKRSKVAVRAKAQIVWITGMSGLRPFGVPDIRPNRVWAGFDINNLIPLSPEITNTGRWINNTGKAPSTGGSKSLIVKTEYLDAKNNVISSYIIDKAAVLMVEPTPIKTFVLSQNPCSASRALTADIKIESPAMPENVALIIEDTACASSNIGQLDGANIYSFGLKDFNAPAGLGNYPVYVEITPAGASVPDPRILVAHLRVIEILATDGYSIIREVKATPNAANQGEALKLEVKLKGWEVGDPLILKLGGKPVAGNFMLLDIDGNGLIKETIIDGSTTALLLGDMIPYNSKPGGTEGQIKQGIEELTAGDNCYWDSSKNTWIDPDTGVTHLGCPRLVTVALVPSYSASTGDEPREVTGFAVFFLADTFSESKKELVGRFVEYPEIGKNWTIDKPSDSLRPKTVRLVPFD